MKDYCFISKILHLDLLNGMTSGFVKSWSKRAEEIFGWTEKEFIEIQENWVGQVIHERYLPWVNTIIEQLISGEVERNKVQYRNATKTAG